VKEYVLQIMRDLLQKTRAEVNGHLASLPLIISALSLRSDAILANRSISNFGPQKSEKVTN
jgi:hypothetical protein